MIAVARCKALAGSDGGSSDTTAGVGGKVRPYAAPSWNTAHLCDAQIFWAVSITATSESKFLVHTGLAASGRVSRANATWQANILAHRSPNRGRNRARSLLVQPTIDQ